MSELSELLLSHLPDGWSRRQVGREAQKRGYALSEASATAYLSGRHGRPDEPTIAALCDVLRIPESALRRAAGLRPQGEPWLPPDRSRYLRHDQRSALEQLILTMVQREVEEDDADLGAMSTPAIGLVQTRAARDAGRSGGLTKARAEQDLASSPPSDDPDDMDPR